MSRRKLRINMTTLMVLLMSIIIPVLFQGYVLGQNAVEKAETLYDQSISKNMGSMSVNLNFYMNNIEDYIRIISNDQKLLDMFANASEPNRSGAPIRERLIELSLVYRLRVPLYVQLIDNRGQTFSNIPLHDTETARLRETVAAFPSRVKQIPNDSNTIYHDVSRDFHDLTASNAFYFSKNLLYRGEHIGLMVVQMKQSLIQRLLRQIQLSDSTLVFIVQDSGEVLLAAEGVDEPLADISRQVIAQSRTANREYSSFHIPWNGATYVASTHNIPYFSWYLVAMTPREVIVSQTRHLWIYTLLLTGSTIVLISAILLFIARKVMVPIANLSRMVRNIRFQEADEPLQLKKGYHYRGIEDIEILILRIRQMLERIGKQITRIKADEREKMQLEMNWLQSQIRPHFVHNAINSIRWMAEMKRDSEIAKAAIDLSSMLNYTLDQSLTSWTVVRDELEYVKRYISFHEQRMLMAIETRLDVDPDTLLARIPKLTLQPIVENVILHGFAAPDRAHKLNIRCAKHGDLLTIAIEDNGVGMEPDVLNKLLLQQPRRKEGSGSGSGSGIGLRNVHRRLQLEYGSQFGIRIASAPGTGTQVTLTIPYLTE